MKRTSELSTDDLNWIDTFLAERPVFRLYHHAALTSVREGLDNREYLISETGNGLVISIRFDDCRIATTIGQLSDAELGIVAAFPDSSEVHAEPEHEAFLLRALGNRINSRKVLKYYLHADSDSSQTDSSALTGVEFRRLTTKDYPLASAFYRAHYSGTIFSQWMLEQPFVGIFENSELIATAGTIILNKDLCAANIGNFLTRPDRRGRGLAKNAALALMTELRREGITQFSLGTTEDNISAWKAYEHVGFQCIETRAELHVKESVKQNHLL